MQITSTQARALAEARWGRGGTTAYKTNRAGAYYYACSGHGGFIINASVLTDEERAKVNRYLKPQQVQVIYDLGTKRVRKVRGPDSTPGARYTCEHAGKRYRGGGLLGTCQHPHAASHRHPLR